MLKQDRILGLIAVATVILAGIVGNLMADKEIIPFLKKAMPQASRIEVDTGGYYLAYNDEQIIGYLSICQADGYGGPLKIGTAVDLKGLITGIVVIEEKETASFFRKVISHELIDNLLGRKVTDTFVVGEDVDGVSGATYSSTAVVGAVSQAAHTIGKDKLGLTVPKPSSPKIRFGVPEITVILLFIFGWVGRRKQFKYTKQIRWVSLLTGLVVLGFLYNRPLTLSKISGLLLGFIPAWQTYIYWMLLLGGIILFLTLDKKNSYCHWFCPFGAAQECLGIIGGAKVRTPHRFRAFLRWTQRALAWVAIILALLFRNPGVSGYEIFGALFSLTGSSFQMILLVIILLASLFLKKPWCHYLCPIPPVTDLFRMFRKWITEIWKKKQKQTV